MDHEKLLAEIRQTFHSRFDRVEDKLDSHLERIAIVETKVKHHQGFIKTTIAVIIASVTSLLAYFGKKFI